MADRSGIEFRLVLTLGVIALVAVVGILAIVPYRLYQRDIRTATEQAQQVSSVVHSALSCPLGSGSDATDLVNRLQSLADLEIRLSRLDRPDEHPLHRSRAGSSLRQDTDLLYVAPPVLDGRGGSWLAELHFDLSSMKRDSVRLIIDLVLAVVLGAAAFSVVIFTLFRRALLAPLEQLTQLAERLATGESGEEMPRFENPEMTRLARAIERLAAARSSY